MKKIFSFIILAACLAAFTACSDDSISNPYAVEKAIKVVKADVLFPVTASTGSVTVEAANGITKVVNTADWIAYSIDGNTITVSVTENTKFTGRNSRLSIYSGSDSTYVVVQQEGIDFIMSAGSEITTNDDAQKLAYYMHSNMPFEITGTDDWFTAVLDGDSIRIDLTANETGKFRHGTLKYKVGPIEGEILVTQKDFDKDVLGDYKIVYVSSNKWVYTTGTLERTEAGGFQMRFTASSYANRGIILPVTLSEGSLTTEISNCVEVQGTYTKDDVDYSLIGYTMYQKGTSIYRNKSVTYSMIGKFNENEDGTFTWDFDLSDATKTASGGTYYGLRIAYTTGGYEGNVGSYVTFASMYWEKE